MRILFLDIDGVLNTQKYLKEVWDKKKRDHVDLDDLDSLANHKMLDIDMNKLKLLKEIVDECDLSVVITSSWKRLTVYPLVEKRLIELGIPVVGVTIDNMDNRGKGIKNYIKKYNIEEYIVLDDDIFYDYDEEILKRLVKTSFYEDGLDEEKKEEAIRLIKK